MRLRNCKEFGRDGVYSKLSGVLRGSSESRGLLGRVQAMEGLTHCHPGGREESLKGSRCKSGKNRVCLGNRTPVAVERMK